MDKINKIYEEIIGQMLAEESTVESLKDNLLQIFTVVHRLALSVAQIRDAVIELQKERQKWD